MKLSAARIRVPPPDAGTAQGRGGGEPFGEVGGDLTEGQEHAEGGVEHGGAADHDAIAEQVQGDAGEDRDWSGGLPACAEAVLDVADGRVGCR